MGVCQHTGHRAGGYIALLCGIGQGLLTGIGPAMDQTAVLLAVGGIPYEGLGIPTVHKVIPKDPVYLVGNRHCPCEQLHQIGRLHLFRDTGTNAGRPAGFGHPDLYGGSVAVAVQNRKDFLEIPGIVVLCEAIEAGFPVRGIGVEGETVHRFHCIRLAVAVAVVAEHIHHPAFVVACHSAANDHSIGVDGLDGLAGNCQSHSIVAAFTAIGVGLAHSGVVPLVPDFVIGYTIAEILGYICAVVCIGLQPAGLGGIGQAV